MPYLQRPSRRSGARAAALAVALAVLGGCATPTPYQPAADGFGYADQAIEANRYRVSFTGNSSTARTTVENYLLYRAAEVTLAQGYDYFVVVTADTERRTSFDSTTTGVGGHHRFGGFGHPHHFGGFATTTTRARDEYAAYLNILLHRGAEPAEDPQAYDARQVVERLRPVIETPPDS